MYINFCAFSSNRSWDQRIPKNPENVWLQRHLLNDFHQKLIETNLYWGILNTKVHEILFVSSPAILATKFLSHTQTDRHFPEIVKSCSEHCKTCRFIKNQKSKICTKPIFSFTYIEESKNIWCLPVTRLLLQSVWCAHFRDLKSDYQIWTQSNFIHWTTDTFEKISKNMFFYQVRRKSLEPLNILFMQVEYYHGGFREAVAPIKNNEKILNNYILWKTMFKNYKQ